MRPPANTEAMEEGSVSSVQSMKAPPQLALEVEMTRLTMNAVMKTMIEVARVRVARVRMRPHLRLLGVWVARTKYERYELASTQDSAYHAIFRAFSSGGRRSDTTTHRIS